MAHLLCEARPPRRGDSGSGQRRYQYDTPITWLRKAIPDWRASSSIAASVGGSTPAWAASSSAASTAMPARTTSLARQ